MPGLETHRWQAALLLIRLGSRGVCYPPLASTSMHQLRMWYETAATGSLMNNEMSAPAAGHTTCQH